MSKRGIDETINNPSTLTTPHKKQKSEDSTTPHKNLVSSLSSSFETPVIPTLDGLSIQSESDTPPPNRKINIADLVSPSPDPSPRRLTMNKGFDSDFLESPKPSPPSSLKAPRPPIASGSSNDEHGATHTSLATSVMNNANPSSTLDHSRSKAPQRLYTAYVVIKRSTFRHSGEVASKFIICNYDNLNDANTRVVALWGQLHGSSYQVYGKGREEDGRIWWKVQHQMTGVTDKVEVEIWPQISKHPNLWADQSGSGEEIEQVRWWGIEDRHDGQR